MAPPPDVTVLLHRAQSGDESAFRRVVGQLYDELRAVARSQRRRLGASETVNTTAVVHEAYAKLAGRDGEPDFVDRQHFLRVASRAMRDVIVDSARAQRAEKRGGGETPLRIHQTGVFPGGLAAQSTAINPDEVLALDRALRKLDTLDAEQARLVELRYFSGLTLPEVADALDISLATAKRRWTVARAWLYRELSADAPPTQ